MNWRRWVLAVLAVVTVGFAVHFGMTFPWSSTLHALQTSDWLLLTAAAVANIVSLAVKGGEWYVFLRRIAPVRFATAQLATFAGAALSCITVSVSGDVARASVVTTRGEVTMGAAVASLILTRFVEIMSLLVFLAVALIAAPPFPSANLIGLGLGLVTGVVFLGYRRLPWDRIRSRRLGKWRGPLIEMVASTDRLGLVAAVFLACLNWLLQWASFHWAIAATHTPVHAAISLSALVAANAAGLLRLTPGNFGVLQGSLILVMEGFGVPAASALAAGVALQAIQVLPELAIGLALLGSRGLRQLARHKSEVGDMTSTFQQRDLSNSQ
ncbi:MAG: lysylphosphatidylglycerol synthase transmembrane domain-containing protein [Gemmatimonadota bacterium]